MKKSRGLTWHQLTSIEFKTRQRAEASARDAGAELSRYDSIATLGIARAELCKLGRTRGYIWAPILAP